jgi:hypothetical protein
LFYFRLLVPDSRTGQKMDGTGKQQDRQFQPWSFIVKQIQKIKIKIN